MKLSKTTVNGILAAILAILGALLSYQVPVALLSPQASRTWLYITAGATLLSAILRALVGVFQGDAPPSPPPGPPTANTSTQKLGAIMLCVVLLGGSMAVTSPVIMLTGCTPAQVENEINTVLQEATGIIAVADPGVSWLADFSKATALLKVDEANWIKGGAVQDVINVLNDLQGVTALISPLVPYASLIGVLVAGIDAVLALLLPAPSTAAPAALSVRTVAPANPFKGMATVKSASDSKNQWNAIAKANPALAKAVI